MAQNVLDSTFCDCRVARILKIDSVLKIKKTFSPVGHGQVKEISSANKWKYSFSEEHNSAWYKLVIGASGMLTFEIVPLNKNDDYDFMLFSAPPGSVCESVFANKNALVRSCISKNNNISDGKTGLSHSASKLFVQKGLGPSYVKSISVATGEVYYLFLDNVTEGGKGHYMELAISKKVDFKGIVLDDNSKPLSAEIILSDKSGDTLFKTKTTKAGSYQFNAYLAKSKSYTLNFYSDSSFTYSKSVSLRDTGTLMKLVNVLPRLKKGKKYSVGAINFVGNSTQYLAKSRPALNNLEKLMRRNKSLKIKVIGHSNGRFNFDSTAEVVEFTLKRANAIKDFLVEYGIDQSRIETEGKGDFEMLYHQPYNSEWKMEQNRRVEIMVLEY